MRLSFGDRHIISGLDPVADAFSGTVYSDVVNVANWGLARFTLFKGVGATGTSTLTVEACDNAAGDNPVAIPFRYQAKTAAASSSDVPAASAAATTTGFATTAGSSQLYAVEADTKNMPAAKSWLRLKAVEVVDSPVLGGVLIELSEPRYATDIPATAIA